MVTEGKDDCEKTMFFENERNEEEQRDWTVTSDDGALPGDRGGRGKAGTRHSRVGSGVGQQTGQVAAGREW